MGLSRRALSANADASLRGANLPCSSFMVPCDAAFWQQGPWPALPAADGL